VVQITRGYENYNINQRKESTGSVKQLMISNIDIFSIMFHRDYSRRSNLPEQSIENEHTLILSLIRLSKWPHIYM